MLIKKATFGKIYIIIEMKLQNLVIKFGITLLFICLYSILSSSSLSINKEIESEPLLPQKRSGTAIIITGAAARLPQEAALLEKLDERGLLKDVVFISGVSSGALNAVMLNGILSKKITWDNYKQILFKIRDSNIYIQKNKKIPVITAPSRKLYYNVIEKKLGYPKIGDLPIPTAISITHLTNFSFTKTVYRLFSQKINHESDTNLSLVDILMATTAFPLVFPPARIKNAKTIPNVEYVDGGFGDDRVPFHSLFEFEKFRGKGVKKVYIISRKSALKSNTESEFQHLGLNDKESFSKMGVSIDVILQKGLIDGLKDYAKAAPNLVAETYIWIPGFKENFQLFNFNTLKKQYNTTFKWANTHQPIPLSNFLLPYLLRRR